MAKYAKKDGLKVTKYTFSDTNDVNSVTQQAASASDVIYIPTDNTAASYAKTINNVALKAKMPIITGEEGIMSKCGFATLSIDYYGLGKQTGKMAVQILTGKKKIAQMPVQYYKNPVKEYNPTICKKLGIKVPAGGQRQALTLLMATLVKPKVLLLDEHTAALDPKTAEKVLKATDRIVAEGKLTTIMVTHNMRDAIAHGNRLIMMNDGKVVLDIKGEEKQKLTVEKLLHQFEVVSGEEFASDKAILG
ncbi:ABC transporter substrate binding protein [Lactobacillus delbrueckii]|uniref:ABC transporter substrate binding protein n=1 Tax=Lactobacillus delbrueckii TaxID=1584 RepID=UPI001E2B8A04|nr:ABC transporter substrate binding protein [Lactobacillus delbrueckii]MCD5466055.1 hypothetical protein [Lactobacillus delbrueckii subsp. bulgaricus]MCT3467376.1 hypothetical protein [Lactobacillus delbrueckii subsp. bulgaricus]